MAPDAHLTFYTHWLCILTKVMVVITAFRIRDENTEDNKIAKKSAVLSPMLQVNMYESASIPNLPTMMSTMQTMNYLLEELSL